MGVLLSSGAMAQQSVADDSVLLRQPDAAWRPYAQLQSWAANDAIPLRDFDGKWEHDYAPRQGTNRFLQRHRAEAGVETRGWSIGVEYRLEATLDADRDTLDVYRSYKQKAQPAQARAFLVDAHMKAWSAGGVRVGHTIALGDAGSGGPLLKISGALYENLRNRDVDAAGVVTYTPGNVYGFNAQYQDSNTRYRYQFMPDAAQRSSGASLSMALQWPLTSALTANLALNDVWSRMRWSSLPSVVKAINSKVSSTDQDGNVNYQPLLQGKNSLIDKRGTIGASAAASVGYQLAQWEWRLRVDRLDGIAIPAVAAAYHGAWGTVGADAESRFHTVGLRYAKGPFSVHLRSNRWPISEASAAALDVGLHASF